MSQEVHKLTTIEKEIEKIYNNRRGLSKFPFINYIWKHLISEVQKASFECMNIIIYRNVISKKEIA